MEPLRCTLLPAEGTVASCRTCLKWVQRSTRTTGVGPRFTMLQRMESWRSDCCQNALNYQSDNRAHLRSTWFPPTVLYNPVGQSRGPLGAGYRWIHSCRPGRVQRTPGMCQIPQCHGEEGKLTLQSSKHHDDATRVSISESKIMITSISRLIYVSFKSGYKPFHHIVRNRWNILQVNNKFC